MSKYIHLKFMDIEDHKKFEVSWLFQVVQIDRQKGELTLQVPSIEELERVVKRQKSLLGRNDAK